MSESAHRRAFDVLATRARDRLGESLHSVTLFGSVVHGGEGPDSDVDILAVVEKAEDKRALHDLAFEVEVEHGVVLSLLVRTPAEYAAMDGSELGRELEQGVAVG